MADSLWWDTILPTELLNLRKQLLNELRVEFGKALGAELEDIVQHAFVVLFRRRESVKVDDDGLYRYLKTVAGNAAVDRIRTDQRRKQRLFDVMSGRRCESREAAPETQPNGGEEESERIRRVFCALDDLDRLVVWCHVVEGQSIRAIARDLDLNWHNVARTIERTLRRIRSELGKIAV